MDEMIIDACKYLYISVSSETTSLGTVPMQPTWCSTYERWTTPYGHHGQDRT